MTPFRTQEGEKWVCCLCECHESQIVTEIISICNNLQFRTGRLCIRQFFVENFGGFSSLGEVHILHVYGGCHNINSAYKSRLFFGQTHTKLENSVNKIHKVQVEVWLHFNKSAIF